MSELSNDLLWGGGPITEEMFGDDTRPNRRKLYHLFQQGRLDGVVWKEGGEFVSRRSKLNKRFNPPTTNEAAE
jgi:hypothetical protein